MTNIVAHPKYETSWKSVR